MRLPQGYLTWIMTLLLAALLGLAGWMFWALGKVEDARQKGRPAAVEPSAR